MSRRRSGIAPARGPALGLASGLAFGTVLGSVLAPAVAGDPQVKDVVPTGGRRGGTVEVRIVGDRLKDAAEVFFHDHRLRATAPPIVDGKALRVPVEIDADCPPGRHLLQVRTAGGLSNLMVFSIGTLEELDEVEPNDDPAAPQVVPFPSTISGVANTEDLDVFAFDLNEGDEVVVEVEGMRLGRGFFDPALVVLDPDGFMIASCDDSSLLRQDPVTTFTATRSGRHLVQVREAAFAGNGRSRYRLHLVAGTRPRDLLEIAADAEPMPTSMAAWRPLGTAPVLVDPARPLAPGWTRTSASTPIAEAEPNDGRGAATEFGEARSATGRIDRDGDVDWYRVTAPPGTTLGASVFARRLRSPLDAVLRIVGSNGRQLARGDDDRGLDPVQGFKVPDDGVVFLQVRDHLDRGAADAAYRLDVGEPATLLTLARPPRTSHGVTVPAGGRSAWILDVERAGPDGVLDLAIGGGDGSDGDDADRRGLHDHSPDLPPGVGRCLLVLSADADAEPGCRRVAVEATIRDEAGSPRLSGGYRADAELVLGRNNVPVLSTTLDRLPVAIVDPLPYRVELAPPATPLPRAGVATIRVQVERDEGDATPIRLTMPLLPPGVSANLPVVVAGDATDATIRLVAAGDARLGDFPLVVVADAPCPAGGRRHASTAAEPITIVPPLCTVTSDPSSIDRGAAGGIGVRVATTADFPGARLRLQGLPHGVTTDATPAVDAAGGEVAFPLAAAGDAALGNHGSVGVLIDIDLPGGRVTQSFRLPPLRVNAPPPPPKTAVAAAPPPPPPPPTKDEPAARPPTRLEKLRAEAEARRKAAEGGDS